MKELLKKLIRTEPMEQNGELAAARVLCEYLSAAELEVSLDEWGDSRANVLSHIKTAGQRPGLLFACHMDVVPPGEAPWKYAPFDAVESDGKIHGRGSADMKAGLVAAVEAIVEIHKSGTQLKGDLILAATAGEETDSCGVKRFMARSEGNLGALCGIVIPEPTNFDIVTAHRGMCWLEVCTKGRTAHGSMPHLGINAIIKMNALLNRLADYELCGGEHPMLGKPSMSINRIAGGKATNVIPDRCLIQVDIRTVPGQDNRVIISDFEAMFAELRKHDSQFDAELKITRTVPALETDTDSPFVRTICDITGIDQTKAVSFTTDAPFFAQNQTPVVIFGPGNSELCHKPDEYVEIADLEKAKQIYKKIILEILT